MTVATEKFRKYMDEVKTRDGPSLLAVDEAERRPSMYLFEEMGKALEYNSLRTGVRRAVRRAWTAARRIGIGRPVW